MSRTTAAHRFESSSDVPEELKKAVWDKGLAISGFNPAIWRQDDCGLWMRYSDHENTSSHYGWQIGRVGARVVGTSDELANLRPFQWQNYRLRYGPHQGTFAEVSV